MVFEKFVGRRGPVRGFDSAVKQVEKVGVKVKAAMGLDGLMCFILPLVSKSC